MVNCTGSIKNTPQDSKQDSIYASDYQIKSIKFSNDPDPIYLSYNSKGDLIQVKHGTFICKYEYTDSIIISKSQENKDNSFTRCIYIINNNGQIIQTKIFGWTRLEGIVDYIYDENGYLLQTISRDRDDTDSIFISHKYLNGNLIEKSITSHYMLGAEKTIFEYSPQFPNTFNVFHDSYYPEAGELIERDRFGKGNLHLPSSKIILDEKGDTVSIIKYAYPKGRTETEFIQIKFNSIDSTETRITYQLRKIK